MAQTAHAPALQPVPDQPRLLASRPGASCGILCGWRDPAIDGGVLWTARRLPPGHVLDARAEATRRADALLQALIPFLDAATSTDPDGWRPDAPAWGHCALVAALLDPLTTGAIVRTVAHLPDGRAIGHYYNILDGIPLDATRRQFPAGTVIDERAAAPRRQDHDSTRAYILSSDTTRARFELLSDRLGRSGRNEIERRLTALPPLEPGGDAAA